MSIRQIVAGLFALMVISSAYGQDGYLQFRGNAQRTSETSKLPAWEKRVAWQRPLLKDKLEGFNDADNDDEAEKLIAELRKKADPTILPGSFPIIVNDICIYRSYRDVRAVTLQGYEIKTEEGQVIRVRPDELLWKSIPSRCSLSVLMEKPQSRPIGVWTTDLLRAKKQEPFLWANTTIGILNSDGKNVYVANDFAYPAIDAKVKANAPNWPVDRSLLIPMIRANELYGHDAKNGKLHWDLNDEDLLFKDSHFLGAPLPVDGRLFALNEKALEIRLVTINSTKTNVVRANVKPIIDSMVVLAKIAEAEQLVASPLRRSQAAQIAQTGDLLVCPTNAGFIIGFDHAKREARWQYRYREEKVAPPSLPFWQAACPIVHKDRIIIAAADAPDIHCLDLDGKKKWTASVADGLYVATVHDDIVLIVSKNMCHALKISDGAEKWKLEIKTPAGIGVMDGSLYYLPLKKTIWAIDLAKGTKAHQLQAPYPDALGNLALHRGLIVSQSVTHIAAFPLAAK